MTEIYFSTDIETDGPIPGQNSMLSLGSAAFIKNKVDPVQIFSVNFETLDGANPDPDTMDWWLNSNKEAYLETRQDVEHPEIAMKDFYIWINDTCRLYGGKPVFVGYPAGFDFLFVYWYLIKFVGKSPFSFSALDIKSFAMAKLGTEYRQTTKKNFPKHWFPPNKPHTHIALDDAIEQGYLFMNILKDGGSYALDRNNLS